MNVFQLYNDYVGHILSISWLDWIGCIFTASWMYLDHIFAVSCIYFGFILTVSWLYLSCILAVYVYYIVGCPFEEFLVIGQCSLITSQ